MRVDECASPRSRSSHTIPTACAFESVAHIHTLGPGTYKGISETGQVSASPSRLSTYPDLRATGLATVPASSHSPNRHLRPNMCGYTLHLTNSTNQCGNYTIVIGHPADPTMPRITKDGVRTEIYGGFFAWFFPPDESSTTALLRYT